MEGPRSRREQLRWDDRLMLPDASGHRKNCGDSMLDGGSVCRTAVSAAGKTALVSVPGFSLLSVPGSSLGPHLPRGSCLVREKNTAKHTRREALARYRRGHSTPKLSSPPAATFSRILRNRPKTVARFRPICNYHSRPHVISSATPDPRRLSRNIHPHFALETVGRAPPTTSPRPLSPAPCPPKPDSCPLSPPMSFTGLAALSAPTFRDRVQAGRLQPADQPPRAYRR